MGVHADDHLPRVGLDSPVVRHRVASSGAGASAGWADRTVMGRRCRRPLLGHCPSGQTGCRVHRRRTMTDRSVARTVGQSSCGQATTRRHPPVTEAGSGSQVTRRGRNAGSVSLIVQQAHVTAFHSANARVRSKRWCAADPKRFSTSPCTERNRCACTADLNRRICRSRCRVG